MPFCSRNSFSLSPSVAIQSSGIDTSICYTYNMDMNKNYVRGGDDENDTYNSSDRTQEKGSDTTTSGQQTWYHSSFVPALRIRGAKDPTEYRGLFINPVGRQHLRPCCT